MAIGAELRRRVVERAQNRCEYCGLAQASQEAAFHVDHAVPVSVGGPTRLDNLALACVSCSLRKGARRATVAALRMNRALVEAIRAEEAQRGRHPPPGQG
jgi:5-methylcytosine-specific restriction endonuclease McrA